MLARKIHLIVTGSEVYTGRIKDGFEPIVRKKVGEMGLDLADKKLVTDDPDQIANLIQDAHKAGAELILVSGGMSVDPTKTPKESAAVAQKLNPMVFPCCRVPCSSWPI